jgi:tRNA(His) 5'-end guanylyltransferase
MGSAQDLQNEAFRRMLVNATFWTLGREGSIPQKADVGIVGTFTPSPFKFGGHQRGRKPEQF